MSGERFRVVWKEAFSEAELYKAAVRLYTRPLFQRQKAFSCSTDDQNLYDFAQHGLQKIEAIYKSLAAGRFVFRPGLRLVYNFNGKKRTIYLYPWEERLIDLMLYRVMNQRLSRYFSPNSYAYRQGPFGVDCCQREITRAFSRGDSFYVVKRDIRDYFSSIDHAILLEMLAAIIPENDYLFQILRQRIAFSYVDGDRIITATRGIPFGAAVACVFANLYLTRLDRELSRVPMLRYFRYADDLLAFSENRETVCRASRIIDQSFASLKLESKKSHHLNILFAKNGSDDTPFRFQSKLRHLGLEFRAKGPTGLSRDKFRKICNLFRFAFRRAKNQFKWLSDPVKRARLAVDLAQRVINKGIRNVAIIDYYLKHIQDERQLRLLDRWLAEEVLAIAFQKGYKKGSFRKMPYGTLRELGLPSLVHRRRLILHQHIDSTFFVWKKNQPGGFKGTAAKSRNAAFSRFPEAAANNPREGEGCLFMGVIEEAEAKALLSFSKPSS